MGGTAGRIPRTQHHHQVIAEAVVPSGGRDRIPRRIDGDLEGMELARLGEENKMFVINRCERLYFDFLVRIRREIMGHRLADRCKQ